MFEIKNGETQAYFGFKLTFTCQNNIIILLCFKGGKIHAKTRLRCRFYYN